MSDEVACTCGSFERYNDLSRGDTICVACGKVLEDSTLVSEVQFEENAHGGSSALGHFVSADASRAGMSITGKFTYGNQKTSREMTEANARKEINRVANQLGIIPVVADAAFIFYKQALDYNITKGRRIELVCSACLYIACRYDKNPSMNAYLLIDFSDILDVDPFVLGRTFTHITQSLFLNPPLIDPCVYVLRYASQMNLKDRLSEVTATACRILKRMKDDFIHCGRRPSGLCGSALILATRYHGVNRSLKDIVNIVRIQENTLKKRLLEFGDTPSSMLTTDEFFNVDLEEKQDPPSFKASRIRDKERLNKAFDDSDYGKELKKIQKMIEKQIDVIRKKGNRKKSCEQTNSSTVKNTRKRKSKQNSNDILGEIIRDDITDDDCQVTSAVIKSTVEILDSVCVDNDIAANYLTSQTEHNDIEITKNTNAVILEESSIPIIDHVSLDDLDDEELDDYIISEEEAKGKEKAWTKLYADYLQDQKIRDEERKLREKEEEGKPPKKKRKSRKVQSGVATTAGEAVRNVIREKKLSKKLNYDVLKCLEGNSVDNLTHISARTLPLPMSTDEFINVINDSSTTAYKIDDDDCENDYFDDENDNESGNILSIDGEYNADDDYEYDYGNDDY